MDFKITSKLVDKIPRTETAKIIYSKRSPKLLSLNRETVRIITGLLTGHSRENIHMSTIVWTEETTSKSCQGDERTTEDILCHLRRPEYTNVSQIGAKYLRQITMPKSRYQNHGV